MLLEGPVLFLILGFACISSAVIALRVLAHIRGFQLEPVRHPGVLAMSRAEMTPISGLGSEAEREAPTDVKPLPWLHCTLLILLASGLCYGLGYFAVTALLHGRL